MPVLLPSLAVGIVSVVATVAWGLLSKRGEANSSMIPLLDVTNLDDARLVRRAAKDLGIFRLVGHGVNVSAALDASRLFFAQPDAVKRSARSSSGAIGGFQRGYIPLAGESGLRDFVELKEGFCYGRALQAGLTASASKGNGTTAHPDAATAGVVACDQLVSPNAWPIADDAVGDPWRRTLETVVDDVLLLTDQVHRGLSRAMGRDADFLAELASGGEDISLMRLFHYFPSDAFPHVAPGTPRTGSSPHTDWHLVTIILQDATGGLQVRRPRPPYDWIDVLPVEGELIVILGDYLNALSEGNFISPVHRVLLPTHPHDRYSLTYFRYPGCAATVSKSAAQRAERVAQRRARQRRRHPGGGGKFNTLVAPQPEGEGLSKVATRPWGDLLVDKWNGVASNKLEAERV